ncbi:AraC family transcriptional regulator [Paenibacillus abyssi]|uniref:AraC family transcriptional regulator n=1 Tax=Paenibacillus abyssi TaxID=1340531 RepID=A0A917FUY5_9BACL|nr:AraC family transcriptional regulator [Paenibacillus abyssi]GGG03598.1 AraC family transcriptional regulator [Paenibacillus abyssi]
MTSIYPYYFTDYHRVHPDMPFTIDIHLIDRFPAHRHDFLEISLVIEGSGKEIVNGVEHPMEPGTLTLVLPFQFHELRADPGSTLKLYNCMFSVELLTDTRESAAGFAELLLGGEDDRPTFFQLTDKHATDMARIFQEMLEEFEGRRTWRIAILKAKLMETMIRVDRLRSDFHQQASIPVPKRGELPDSIWKVIRYMHVHYRDALTLSGLAETFHFNETYLSEQIKRHAGVNFIDLLHEIRLRHACSLLVSTEMTVSDIAYEIGYGSSNTLYKAFQKYKGVTPGSYRSGIN